MSRLFDAGFRRLLDGLALVGCLVIAASVVLVCVNVAGRALGLGGVRWTDEASEYGLYAVTLLAAPWLLDRAQHIRVDIVLTSLPPRAGWALEILADVAGFVLSLALAWYGFRATAQSAAFGMQTIKTLVFPEWWLLLPLPVSFALIAIVFARRIAAALAGPRRASASDAASLF
jgi:TRAP-type transport system small permease protein